jgi:hypothetical protein
LFRAARQVIQAACGDQTLAGDLRMLADHERDDAPTLAAPSGGGASSKGAGRFAFYIKDGSNVYPLHFGLNSVGRLPDNDVVIRDECVSRRHCAVVVHHDVASKNGTLLNGRKIPGPTKLQSGDQITLCGRKLSFHITELATDSGT